MGACSINWAILWGELWGRALRTANSRRHNGKITRFIRVLKNNGREADAQRSGSAGLPLLQDTRKAGTESISRAQARSKRSRFMTLFHAATKSRTKTCGESLHP